MLLKSDKTGGFLFVQSRSFSSYIIDITTQNNFVCDYVWLCYDYVWDHDSSKSNEGIFMKYLSG